MLGGAKVRIFEVLSEVLEQALEVVKKFRMGLGNAVPPGIGGTVRPGLPRCRDAVMSDSWTSGRSGVGLAAYEAER